MVEELCKTIGLIIIIGFVIYFIVRVSRFQMSLVEGMTNSTPLSATGEASNASNYANQLKTSVATIQDSLLIPKYRANYENIIVDLHDYCNFLLLQQTLSINPNKSASDNIEVIKTMNELDRTSITLNNLMKFIDSK
jgi:hypothetical protein